MLPDKSEIEVLRRLASTYMEYATLPVQREKKDLWRRLNNGDMQRPMVNMEQIPWSELDFDGFLQNQVQHRFRTTQAVV